MWVYLLAQNIDPISGGAGWVGAGLLGLVLGWLLLKHLPEKDRQIRDLIDLHLKTETEQRIIHATLEREQRAEFRGTLSEMMEHSRRQVEGLGLALKEDLQSLQKVIEDLPEVIERQYKESRK